MRGTSNNNDNSLTVCSITEGKSQHNFWILDFGCDSHMFLSRDSLDTDESSDEESLFMGNNAK